MPVRVLGWGVGGAAATIAALVLWPSFPRGEDRRRLARATRGLAELIDARFGADDPAATPVHSEALRVAVETPVQSFGPSARDRALVFLSHETARLLALLEAPRPVASLAVSDAAGELRRVASDTLSASADALDGGTGSIPLRALRDERDRYATAVDDWAQRELTRGTDPGEVLDRLGADYELRSAALGALIIGVNAGMVAGQEAAPDVVEDHAMPIPRRSTGTSALQIAGAQWHGDSVVMRNSIRAGVGLGLTILVGGLVGVEHAFWVTLAAVTVLRSNAVGTGHTALQALAGTVAGFAVAAGLIIVVDDRSTVLWVVLPILVFLAAYAPTAIQYAVGQAAFTLFVVAPFNIVQPTGWEVGLIRVEDIALGAGICVVVGALFWPRGARGRLALTLADAFRTGSEHLAAAFTVLLGDTDVDAAADDARETESIAASQRAELALSDLLQARAAMPEVTELWGALLVGAGRLRIAADRLEHVRESTPNAPGCTPARTEVLRDGQALAAHFRAIATSLGGGPTPATAALDDGRRRATTLDCLRSWAQDPSVRPGAQRVLWADEWIRRLAGVATDLHQPAADAAHAAATPWWR